MINDVSCSYIDGKIKWLIRVSPTFIDITCPTRNTAVTFDISTESEQIPIEFEINDEFNCGSYLTEGFFHSGDKKLIVGTSQPADPEEYDPYGYVELNVPGFLGSFTIPFEVSQIVFGIANNLPKEKLEDLGATLIQFLS
jgi:hypothetical protein